LTIGAQGKLLLLCRARTRSCALPVVHVAETMRPLPTVPIAGAPSFVVGVSIIRGEPTPLVDIGALLGAPDPPCFGRFVTVRAGARQVALGVEEVLRLQEVTLDALGSLPPLLSEVGESAVAAVAAVDAELLLVLDAARLVPETVWPLVAARAHP
jgi:purine-binding chemotaxis protein CheW